jgi:membrane fusion protein (multidrug efflux system)
MKVRVDTHERDGRLLDSDTPQAALATRVHDGVASEAQAAADKVIRDNRGG